MKSLRIGLCAICSVTLQEVLDAPTLRDSQRALIAFLTRALEGLEGDARQEAAGRLCVLRGYATGGVCELDAAGLMRAAADGAAAAGIELLLLARAPTGGEALVAAATHGHCEAVAALIDAGVAVEFRSAKVGQSTLRRFFAMLHNKNSIDSCRKLILILRNE